MVPEDPSDGSLVFQPIRDVTIEAKETVDVTSPRQRLRATLRQTLIRIQAFRGQAAGGAVPEIRNRKRRTTKRHSTFNEGQLLKGQCRRVTCGCDSKMEKFVRVEKKKEDVPIGENEVRVTAVGRLYNYVNYAATLYNVMTP